jgi:diguanylate cyclase (GGDEF)-like protein
MPIEHLLKQPAVIVGFSILGMLGIGWLNMATSVDLRWYPLYFLPLVWVAWNCSGRLSIFLACVASVIWALSMYWGGREYAAVWIWGFNVLTQAVAFVVVAYLVHQLRAALLRERLLSRTDPLTGLANRRAFYEQADALLALCRRRGWPVSVAFLDLDHFKHINDVYGHARGDDLLCQVAEVLIQNLRDSDLKARMGGDEFVLFLPDTDRAGAEQVLLKLLQGFRQSAYLVDMGVTPSIGVVCAMDAPSELEIMVRAADDLMYDVKVEGRNSIHFKVIG